jgi:hypothetical protein
MAHQLVFFPRNVLMTKVLTTNLDLKPMLINLLFNITHVCYFRTFFYFRLKKKSLRNVETLFLHVPSVDISMLRAKFVRKKVKRRNIVGHSFPG